MGTRMAALLGEASSPPCLREVGTPTREASSSIWQDPCAAIAGMECTACVQRAWPRSPVKTRAAGGAHWGPQETHKHRGAPPKAGRHRRRCSI